MADESIRESVTDEDVWKGSKELVDEKDVLENMDEEVVDKKRVDEEVAGTIE